MITCLDPSYRTQQDTSEIDQTAVDHVFVCGTVSSRTFVPLQEMQSVACEEWSERCSGSRIKAPKGREDFAFEEKSAKDVEMDDLMEVLQASGMGGSMGAFGRL